MSLNTMAQRLALEIPGLSVIYARTLLNEALGHFEDSQLWSFQLADSGWLTPGLLFGSAGAVTFTPYSNLVTPNAAAKTAWLAYAGTPPITSFQIRSPFYSLYNIIAMNPTTGVITLDRPWMEPGGAAQPYMIYQAYFAAPVADFNRFFAVRDTTNGGPLDYWSKTQQDLAYLDPQRTIFDLPQYVVPYQQDQRVGSSTLNYMLFELWPHPVSIWPYSFDYLHRGPQLLNPADIVPFPISEQLVEWQAKADGYYWKEAQKGEGMERGAGADFRFLAQAAEAKVKIYLKQCANKDRNLVDLYFSKFRREGTRSGQPFSTTTGQLNVGRM